MGTVADRPGSVPTRVRPAIRRLERWIAEGAAVEEPQEIVAMYEDNADIRRMREVTSSAANLALGPLFRRASSILACVRRTFVLY
jgi:hypothetical protein